MFTLVTNVNAAVGLDYSSAQNALLASLNYDTGLPNNFLRLGTNGSGHAVASQWTGISGLLQEIKLTVIQQTGNGFTNGDMFFGTGTNGQIGWVSADGTKWTNNWITLTNEPNVLRGSICVDDSGSFGGGLIAVFGDAPVTHTGTNADIWLITSNKQTRLLASIPVNHLEGVIALTNDVQKWGPWAGKVLTGDEDAQDEFSLSQPVIYAVDTNGVVSHFIVGQEDNDDFTPGIAVEGFQIIPTNQDLYIADEHSDANSNDSGIVKLSRTFLASYVGQLLISQGGEQLNNPQFFIVHWDATQNEFVWRSIHYADFHSGEPEQIKFAPLNLPSNPKP
jgi:hypothetical protein